MQRTQTIAQSARVAVIVILFVVSFFVPIFLGNAIGGVTLAATINHAQTKAGKKDESEGKGIIIA